MMILIAAAMMGLIGLVFALFLVTANARFAVEVDPRIAELEERLPGVNCGGCGYASCAAYAEAVARNGEKIDLCVVGGDDTTRDVAHVMGVKVSDEQKDKLVAVVFCQGDSEASAFPGVYKGIPDCAAAIYSQDVAKRCKYGCVGLGSCVESCPFDAIHMSATGIPYVDAEKCTACGNCVIACPRDLIELHPLKHDAFVYCKSLDPGPIARKVCKKACIACNICVKAAAADDNPDAVSVRDNLARVNTRNYSAKPEYGAKCPTQCYNSNRNLVNKEAAMTRIAAQRRARAAAVEA
ncbi:MAG: RnfABCDGE type electron transport complex subunit B [Spirochaetaceae bacterium]|nr:MAG: RnfABCDGE type electron transport complex subunit B [Spirochaetaceae bacterium]